MYGRRQELEETLDAIEDTAGIVAADDHTLAVDRQAVTFGLRYPSGIDLKHHIGTALLLRHLPGETCRRIQHLAQIASLGLAGGILSHRHVGTQFEYTRMLLHMGRLGDDGDRFRHGTMAEGQGKGERRQT